MLRVFKDPCSGLFVKWVLSFAVVYTILQPFHLSIIFYLPLFLLGGFLMTQGKKGLLLFLCLISYLCVSQIQYLRGTAVSIPLETGRITLIYGRLTQEPSWGSHGRLFLNLDLESVESRSGVSGEARGVLSATLPVMNSFGSRRWLRGDHLVLQGRLIERTNPEGNEYYFIGSDLLQYWSPRPGGWRELVIRRVRRVAEGVGNLSETLLPALVLGLKHPDMDSSASLFRETGTAHIIALSGFHSGLVAFLLFSLFRFPLGYRGGLIAAAIGLLIFLYLAGPKPSLVRSVLMYLLVVAGKLSYRKPNLRLILICSFLITGLWAPESLHSLSARLSYLALWGILTTGPLLYNILKRRVGSILSVALSASFAAQIWTLPLVFSIFGLWYPAGILASLVLTPLVTFYLYWGIFLIFLPETSFIIPVINAVGGFLESLLLLTALLFQKIPPITMKYSNPGLFLILLFPLLLGLTYRPGGLSGKRKFGSELRFHNRDKGSSRSNGFGTTQALGTELSD
ncbi:ComEC/Rec2 family competence protein [Oceanispirochaeta crateris]|uniref:ComEC/Rec2 family competence protein n=1 Tax=Oceanispirochaeta crateris TaxID=2518645 RepID=A0A5C1QP33_9SPIO|nr:ComEC/Rec2 family competence protein [Oceanispirochaeta crateris]QEN07942.1 ComEC/Rec2 family competence protein [Oceanispirochaeta crateris]